MTARIETINSIQLVGLKANMSFANNKTAKLWRQFIPQKKLVQHVVSPNLYSIEIYPENFFDDFDAHQVFEKWAAIAVDSFNDQPANFDRLIIPKGLYAVFLHIGPASQGPATYQYIFQEWLPQSPYQLDHRPHVALMDERYKNNDPASEEEIWIPVVAA